MSDELSDREIHEVIEKDSLGCPNCGSRLGLLVHPDTPTASRRMLNRMKDRRELQLVPIEDEIESAKCDRDAGRTWLQPLHPRTEFVLNDIPDRPVALEDGRDWQSSTFPYP